MGKVIITTILGLILAGLFVSGLPVRYSIGYLLSIIAGFVFLTRPVHFLFFLLLSMASSLSFLTSVRIGFASIDLGLVGVLAMAIAGLALFNILVTPDATQRINRPVVKLYAAFCVVQIFAACGSIHKPEAIKVLNQYFSILGIMILMLIHVRNKGQAIFLLKGVVLSAIGPISIALFEFIKTHRRVDGHLGHANILAFFMIVIFGALLFSIYSVKEENKSWVRRIYILLVMVILLLTQTRSGWIAFIIFTGIYIILYNRKFFFPSICVLVLLSFTPFVQQRIDNVFDTVGSDVAVREESSMGGRLTQWKDLSKKFLQKPFTGYGTRGDRHISILRIDAHNDYLRFLMEAGILGLVSYLAPYLYVLHHSFKNARKNFNDLQNKLAKFFVCYVPAFLVMSISENLASYLLVHWYVWTMVGIYFALPGNSTSIETSKVIQEEPQEGKIHV